MFGADAGILKQQNFQLIILANMIPPLGTALMSPVLDSLIDPFGASAANIGLMMSVYTAPAILMIPVAGMLADKYGRKPILVGSLLLFGTAGTAIAFTTDFRIVLGLRILQGVAFSGLTPVLVTSIGDFYTGSTEATAQGLRFTGSGLAQTFFPLMAGILVSIAWFYPFFIYALAIPIALVVAQFMDEPIASNGPVAADGSGESDATSTASESSYARDLFALVTHRRAFAIVFARGLPSLVWLGFLTYNSIIVVRLLDGTPGQAGALVAVLSLIYAAAASQAGRLTNLFGGRVYPLVGANLCLGIGFATVVLAPNIVVAALGSGVIGIGFGLSLSLYRSLVTTLATDSLRGGLVSLSESNGRLIGTVTPIAMGAVIAVGEPIVGFTAAVQLSGIAAAIVCAGGGLLCLYVASTAPPVPGEETAA